MFKKTQAEQVVAEPFRIMGMAGFALLIVVLIYLLLKVAGIIHSLELETILLATVIGQVFYNGYIYRAVEDIAAIKKGLKNVEERIKNIEQKI